MKQYWEAVKPKDSDTHYLIERSLTGPPGDWWQIIKDEVNNFQTFLNKFSRRFWNEKAQHELRRKLEFGCHQVGKMGSRSEYAIRLYAEAKELRPTISPGEIIQKLARHFNEEIKYAIIGRGISHMDDLVELLENFDRIGPINTNKEEAREKKTYNEAYNNHRGSRPSESGPWRLTPRGNLQDGTEHTQAQNSPSWQRNSGYGNRMERSSGQTTGGNTGLNNRPTENRSWRNNSQPTYQVRNMEINEMEPEDEIEEERASSTESGNEPQPRL